MIAIDLGSNTIRAISFDCQYKVFGKSFERMVKTADQLITTGNISDASVKRILEALDDMNEHLGFSGETIVARTTAAMRMAKNSKKVLAYIKDRTGISFEIIDAQKEAFYTQLAVGYRLKKLSIEPCFSLLDVGGGSTELVLVTKDGYVSKSVNVGIVTMSEKFTSKEILVQNLYRELEPLAAFFKGIQNRPKVLVSTAGTPTTLASLKHGMSVKTYDAKNINGTKLTADDFHNEVNSLLAMDEETRALHVGVGRDSLIITGVEILRVLMDILEYTEMIVIDDGLREGLALDFCA